MLSRLIFPAAIVILITTIFINPFNAKSNNTLNDFQGQWAGDFKDSSILLKIYANNSCTLELYDFDTVNKYNGVCKLENKKIPSSLSITSISEADHPLHTLLLPVDSNTIKITTFSTKWRLRQLTFNNDNSIVLKKISK